MLQKLLGFKNYLFLLSWLKTQDFYFHPGDAEFYHFLQMIPKNGYVLDIGSNIGTTSIPLAKRVSQGKVYCFEPIPMHVHVLKKIIRHFKLKNIEIFEIALASENKKLTMVMPECRGVKFQGFSHVVEKEEDKKRGDLFIVDA
jgi:hypothetical protein